jgi:hypothetical protein
MAGDYFVYYEVGDEDEILFVEHGGEDRVRRNQVVLCRGSQKECRTYVARNQNRTGKAKSLRRLPSYER